MLSLGDDEGAPPAPATDSIMDVVIAGVVSPDILGHVVGEFDSMDPQFSFDILLGFVLRSYVLVFSSMDLGIFEYSPVSFIDDIDECAPHSPIAHIHEKTSSICLY